MPSPDNPRPRARGQGPPIQFTLRSMLIFMASACGGQLAGFVGACAGAWQVVIWAEDADRASRLIGGQ